MQQRIKRRRVDGLLVVDKPLGWTSNKTLQKVRWLLKAKKGGHTGNLDPLATGVLPLCFGDATKFAQYGLDADKTYVTRIQLGERRSTGDAEGECLARASLPQLTAKKLEQLLNEFTGHQKQVPPMYSALKHQGKKLYELARAGQEIERPARDIELHELRLLDWGEDFIEIQVHCSKGTYIRVLGEDLAKALGTEGYLGSLRRIDSGDFNLSEALTLEALEKTWEEQGEAGVEALLQPVDQLLQHLARVDLNSSQSRDLTHGQATDLLDTDLQIGENVRLYSDAQTFIGLGEIQQGSNSNFALRPKKMCAS
ncbi:tRNA pseudouridine(55) synthase TruB [Marinospirillum perlucidum]|uniref:tRNA pseudouridine(55) synthase TruB n=1 Tax=Marinospirillum perlucidum TaxID=1982602 RepID=UPI000DF3C068|nr:tRNA pseudouridine(55) synthase TruB [Marinospirillum perlucidum]